VTSATTTTVPAAAAPRPARGAGAPDATAKGEPPPARGGFLHVTRVFNRLVLRLAGTRLLPLYGVIEHRGRRSGTLYRTPVVVRPSGDGFLVPMPWGEGTDWYRNVRGAGGCVIRWKGRDYTMVRPEVLGDPQTARAGFSAFERMAMARLGIDRSLRLHFSA
jgi:deazaflavin-dependent oxidoreductase (nitroreductase family)